MKNDKIQKQDKYALHRVAEHLRLQDYADQFYADQDYHGGRYSYSWENPGQPAQQEGYRKELGILRERRTQPKKV